MSMESSPPGSSENLLEYLKSKNGVALLVTALSVGIAIFHLTTSLTGPLVALRHRPLHVLVITIIVFLSSSVKEKNTLRLAVNVALSLAALGILCYMLPMADDLPMHTGDPDTTDMILGTLSLLIVLEATRRTVGIGLSAIAGFFLLYTWLGDLVPGPLQHAPFLWEDIISSQFVQTEGLWSTPVATMSTFIVVFLIFAGFMVESGMLKVFMDLAFKLVGRQTGGPAKAAVFGSAIVGSLSGSAAADTLIVGSAVIPVMTKAGYPPDESGAIQAGAGTGAQFMPPIMGAAAFIIAAFLGVSYIDVCKGAILPGCLYFFTFACMGHLLAGKLRIPKLSEESLKGLTWRYIAPRLYMLLPVAVIIGLLVFGWSPLFAGFNAIVAVFALSLFRKETRFTPVKIVRALEKGIQSSLSVSMACAAAGIIVGCIMQSGLGFMLSNLVIKLSQGKLELLMPLAMGAALLLGFGMTTVGVYIIVSTLVAPAMIKLGVLPMAAHLFPFFFGIISAITPPVAVAAYSICGLTGGNPWRTGVLSLKYALPALALPFVFVTQPALCMNGSLPEIILVVVACVCGIIACSSSLIGFFGRDLSILERLLFALSGLAIFHKAWELRLPGAIIFLALAATLHIRARKLEEAPHV